MVIKTFWSFVLQNLSPTKRSFIALALVCWTLLLCLSVNTGHSNNFCPANLHLQVESSGLSDKSSHEHCDASDQLLKLSSLNWDDFATPYLILFTLLLLTLVSSHLVSYRFTEPIVSPVRRHLTFGVFRE